MFMGTALCQKVNNKHMLAQNGQRTDPSTREFHVKSAKKRRKSAKTGKKHRNTSEHSETWRTPYLGALSHFTPTLT